MSSARTFASSQPEGMSRLVTVNAASSANGVELCGELEAGNIVYFPRTPFSFPDEDLKFLLASKQAGASYHKNIAYRPAEDRITGLDKSAGADAERLRAIVRGYSQRAEQFLAKLLPPYAGSWKLDFASYRPLEERGRPARLRARNDLPHVDAFPTRPTNGNRILRLFTNINPTQNRVWITSQTFDVLAPRFAGAIGLPAARRNHTIARVARTLASALGVSGARRSPYDNFMHRCHNAMKEDAEFQHGCPKQRWEFPPSSTWMVFTDFVSHAVLEGQYALEQTFILSHRVMVCPEKAPVKILEGLAGHSLTDPSQPIGLPNEPFH
jgi:3-deoxy-D-manno-oct-2-ulosonic acid (Kdo) hydroxylase